MPTRSRARPTRVVQDRDPPGERELIETIEALAQFATELLHRTGEVKVLPTTELITIHRPPERQTI